MTVPLLASVSFACGPSEHVDSASTADVGKGWERRVSNNLGSQLTPKDRVAFGTPLRFDVTDKAYGPEECDGNGCQAKCTIPTRSTDSHVSRVTCDIGCSVKVEAGRTGEASIEIRPLAPGKGNVTIEVTDDKDVTLTTTAKFETAVPTKLPITRDLTGYPHGSVYAALPGTPFRWCFGLADESGPIDFVDMSLALGSEDISSQFDDQNRQYRGFGTERCATFAADAPGDLVVTASTPQLTRRETIHVVSKSDLVKGEIVSLESFGPSNVVPIDRDPLAGRTPLSDMAFDLCDRVTVPVMVRAETENGIRALLPAKSLYATPANLATIDASYSTIAPFDVGEGTIDVVVGGRTIGSVPITVTSGCAPRTDDDAGTPDDGSVPEDAGTD